MRGLLIHGGRDNRTKRAFNDIVFYNIEHNEWLGVLCTGCTSEPRYGHVTFIQGTHLLIFGGVNYQNFVSTKRIDSVELEQSRVQAYIRDQGKALSVKSEKDETEKIKESTEVPKWWA